LENKDYEMLGVLEENYSQLENLDIQTLIKIIKALMKKTDELENIERTVEGEVIVQDDEIVEDEEEIL